MLILYGAEIPLTNSNCHSPESEKTSRIGWCGNEAVVISRRGNDAVLATATATAHATNIRETLLANARRWPSRSDRRRVVGVARPQRHSGRGVETACVTVYYACTYSARLCVRVTDARRDAPACTRRPHSALLKKAPRKSIVWSDSCSTQVL